MQLYNIGISSEMIKVTFMQNCKAINYVNTHTKKQVEIKLLLKETKLRIHKCTYINMSYIGGSH